VFATALSPFARDVAEGLARPQKTLPPSWLYDEIGSALFETITLLPEYGLTRADSALLESAAHEIVVAARAPRLIVELGSGGGSKTRHILKAAAAHGPVEYIPIDISAAALDRCHASLSTLSGVNVRPVEGTYLDGIARAIEGRAALILFLGSTIGNFTVPEAGTFLRDIKDSVPAGCRLLLGADLVKDRGRLLAAYDDPLGVTAAFNLNLLARINRELGGEFRLDRFAHEARYNAAGSRIEMHLRSRRQQTVPIAALGFEASFRKDETIWTESSHKFEAAGVRKLGEDAGWRTVRQWIDSDWGFSETLFSAWF
jgi:dimethylhistidine N-methyltransferase